MEQSLSSVAIIFRLDSNLQKKLQRIGFCLLIFELSTIQYRLFFVAFNWVLCRVLMEKEYHEGSLPFYDFKKLSNLIFFGKELSCCTSKKSGHSLFCFASYITEKIISIKEGLNLICIFISVFCICIHIYFFCISF